MADDLAEAITLWRQVGKSAKSPQERANADKELRALGATLDDPAAGPVVDPADAAAKQARIKRGIANGQVDENRGGLGALGDSFSEAFTKGEALEGLDAGAAAMSERMAFGAPAKIADLVGVSSPEKRRAAMAKQPLSAQVAGVAGDLATAAGGPEALLAKGATKLAAKGAATAFASKAAQGIGTAAGAGALTGGGVDGVRELIENNPDTSPQELVDHLVESAGAGAALGTVGQLAAEGFRGASNLLRKDFWINAYARFKSKGAYDDEVMKKLQGGKEGIHDAAKIGRERIKTRDATIAKDESAKYGNDDAMPGIDDLNPDVENVHAQLDQSVPRYSQSDRPYFPETEGKIDSVKKNLSGVRGRREVPIYERDVQTNVRERPVEPVTADVTHVRKRASEPVTADVTHVRKKPAEPVTAGVTHVRPRGPDEHGTLGGGAYEPDPTRRERELLVGLEDRGFEPDPTRPNKKLLIGVEDRGFEPDPTRPDKKLLVGVEHKGFEADPTRPGNEVVRVDPGEEIIGPKASNRDMLAQRRNLRKGSNFGARSSELTPDNQASRDAYFMVDDAVKEHVPGQRARDEAYSTHKRKRARLHDNLIRSEEGPHVRDNGMSEEELVEAGGDPLAQRWRPGEDEIATRRIKRVGDTNEAGLSAKESLEEIRQADPEFAEALDFVLAKKAKEGTSLNWTDVLPTDQQGTHKAFGLGGLLRQNLRFTGARVADPAAQGGAKLADAVAKYGPLLRSVLMSDPLDVEVERRKDQRK